MEVKPGDIVPGVNDPPVILVDFDHTLSTYTTWAEMGANLGAPVPAMVERVKRWLAAGQEVHIFTARAHPTNPRREEDIGKINAWCRKHVGAELLVTCEKSFRAIAIWDDLAVTVEKNTGWRWSAETRHPDPLTYEDEFALCGWTRPEEK